MPLRVMEEDACGHRTIVKHHPLQRIFKGKNIQTMSMYNIVKSMMQDVLLKGNGYILIKRGESGVITALKYAPANAVSVIYDNWKDTLYYIVTLADAGKTLKVKKEDIIHITRTTRDGINGMSTTQYASDIIDLAKSVERAAKNFFEANMNVQGIFSAKVNINRKQMEEIERKWNANRGRNTVQFMPMGVEYQALGSTGKEAELISTRNENAVEIARFFGVPVQLIQTNQNLTYKAIEDLNNIFYQYTLLGYIRCIEEEFNRKVFSDSELIVDMDEDEFLMRVNKQVLAQYLSTLVGGGIMTVNESRRILGLSEKDNGDDLHIAYSDASKAQIGGEGPNPNVNGNE